MRGRIKFTNEERGYGFITGEDGKEYFFHISGTMDGNMFPFRDKGTRVTFELEDNPKGPRAAQVERAG